MKNTHRCQFFPKLRLPSIKRIDELALRGIGLAALQKRLRTVFLQSRVDEFRDSLIRRGPIGISATKDGERGAFEFFSFEVLDSFDEECCVVRGETLSKDEEISMSLGLDFELCLIR